MEKKQLEIKNNRAWLERVQGTRHITEATLKAIGVPLRYCNTETRQDRNNPFENLLVVSPKGSDKQNQAKEVLTDFIFSAMNNCLPGVTVLAITFSDLCNALTDRTQRKQVQELRKKLYNIQGLFVYDFGIFALREWEMNAVGQLLMHRYNNMKHIALATENISNNHISKHIGPVTWQLVTDYCLCRETP